MTDDPNTPQAATTAVDSAVSRRAVHPCRFCQVPVDQPIRKGQVKDFCCDRHRAAFRDQQVQKAIQRATDAMRGASGELARLSAEFEGAIQLLERYRRHPRKGQKKT